LSLASSISPLALRERVRAVVFLGPLSLRERARVRAVGTDGRYSIIFSDRPIEGRIGQSSTRYQGARRTPMTSKDLLEGILQSLPENRVQEVLDFARFLSLQEDREAWQEFGRRQFARAFGEDEPEYSIGDVKPELES
jgi:hypothetical protein